MTHGPYLCRRENTWQATLGRLENSLKTMKEVDAHFKKAVKSCNDWQSRFKKVLEYLQQLMHLDISNLPAANDLPNCPWNNQDATGILKILDDCIGTTHAKGSWDINLLRELTVLGEYLSGVNSNGCPAIHQHLMVDAGEFSAQRLQQMKIMELNALVVLVFKWLAKSHHKLFEQYIPEEWSGSPLYHPILTSNNLLSVIEKMKTCVLAFSTNVGNVGVYAKKYTPIWLESQSNLFSNILPNGCNVTEEQWEWAKQSILDMIHEPVNLDRITKQYSQLIAAVSNCLFVSFSRS